MVHVLARFSPPWAISQEAGPLFEAGQLAGHLQDGSVRVDRALLVQHLIGDFEVAEDDERLAGDVGVDNFSWDEMGWVIVVGKERLRLGTHAPYVRAHSV